LKCPFCGAVRQSNFSTCSECGREIKIFYEPKVVPAHRGWFVTCPSCGAPKQRNLHKCRKCGEMINVPTVVVYGERRI